MGNVPRPLIGLLVATVAFFALWIVALKPSSNSTGGATKGLGAYQSAINAAHAAVATSKRAAAAADGTDASTSSVAPASSQPAPRTRIASTASTASRHSSAARVSVNSAAAAASRQQVSTVERALASGKVLALLFYNPAGADDQAVRQELSAVPTHSGKVVKLAVPISQLASYPVVTSQVPVMSSPTLVLIDRSRQAWTIVGFSDRYEISQRVADALG